LVRSTKLSNDHRSTAVDIEIGDWQPLRNTFAAKPVDGVFGVWRHLIANGRDIQKAKDPRMSLHAQHFHNACTSCVRR
jgi:hypothetical protein